MNRATPTDAASTSIPALEVTGLWSQFGDHVVHANLNLIMQQGEVLAVVGGSGSGKSVLLNTIVGLRKPDRGSVKILGQEMAHLSHTRLTDLQQRWGVLFQGGALFSSLTVRDNVAAPLFERGGLTRSDIYELADIKIALAGLPADAGNLKPAALSGGMRKRAGLARALSLDPDLLFLDEPTAGLDPISAGAFDDLILQLTQSLGLTVLIVTHDLDTLYTITDRVAVIADKCVVACAPVHTLEQSEHPWIMDYFHGPRGRAAAATAARIGR